MNSISFHRRFGSAPFPAQCRNYIAKNEPVWGYAAQSPEREKLDATIDRMKSGGPYDIPICIGDEEHHSKEIYTHPLPFANKTGFAKCHMADEAHLKKAVSSCLEARRDWSNRPLKERADIFLKAADLISTKYRYDLLASTILGQVR